VKKFQDKYELRQAIFTLFPLMKVVLMFSFFVNLLVLAPSGYMLEVYDRVVNSRSMNTLLMLTVLVLGLYVLLEVIEWVRKQVMQKAAVELDGVLRGKVFHAMLAARLANHKGNAVQPLKDFKTIRDFLPTSSFLAFIDAPFALLVLVVLFLINPLLGWFSVIGAFVQTALGFINMRRIHTPLEMASQHSMASQSYANNVIRNAQAVEAMGMLENIKQRWGALQNDFLEQQAVASEYAGSNAALSKMFQSLVSSMLLGIGCWLALQGQIGGGLMIVGSILGGRVLAPIVRIVSGWRQVEAAWEAYERLEHLLQQFPEPEEAMPLPAPQGALSVEGLVAGPPNTGLQILKGIDFKLLPGKLLVVAGPSASGKTTLARLLVGIWPAYAGAVRLDGHDVYSWNKDELGKSIGYLPQDVELFEGTLAENIARFGDVDMGQVEDTCRLVGLDALVASLPDGLDTEIGQDGAFLSGGQRQRVALARALYGNPSFVVLDEPNSSLDELGDAALIEALKEIKRRGTTVVVISHRTNIVSVSDYMMVLINGRVQKFGPFAEVVESMRQKKPPQKPVSSPTVSVVSIPSGGGRA